MKDFKPYLNKTRIGEEFGVSQPTVRQWVDGLTKEVLSGRYPKQVIAGRHINVYALIDYLTYKDELADKYMRKNVPSFDPIPIARLCGQEGVTW